MCALSDVKPGRVLKLEFVKRVYYTPVLSWRLSWLGEEGAATSKALQAVVIGA